MMTQEQMERKLRDLEAQIVAMKSKTLSDGAIFMPPRVTTAQRDAIVNPREGMVVFNITTHVLNFHNGTDWGAV